MKRIRWDISAGAILLFALMYFFDAIGVVTAMLPAALIHELGHVAALRLCHCRLTRVSIGLTGAELDYAPQTEGWRRLVCLLSGPIAGLLYAFAACSVGTRFLNMSGTVSILLSAFNLLPILPLDGGRAIAAALTERQAQGISLSAALLLTAGGVLLAVRYTSFTLFVMGMWLSAVNIRSLFIR